MDDYEEDGGGLITVIDAVATEISTAGEYLREGLPTRKESIATAAMAAIIKAGVSHSPEFVAQQAVAYAKALEAELEKSG